MTLGSVNKRSRAKASHSVSSGLGSSKAGTSSSRHVGHIYSKISMTGRIKTCSEAHLPTAIQVRQAHDHSDYRERITAMTSSELNELQAIRAGHDEDNWEDVSPEFNVNLDDILAGNTAMDISHAGGEFTDMVEIADDLLGSSSR